MDSSTKKTKTTTTAGETGIQQTSSEDKKQEQPQPKPKFKIGIVGSSPDGDRLFCVYKYAGKMLIRGYYDFLKSKFILLTFQPGNLQEDQTPEYVLSLFAHDLMDEFDWEFPDLNRILKLIKKGVDVNKKKQRKRKNKKTVKDN